MVWIGFLNGRRGIDRVVDFKQSYFHARCIYSPGHCDFTTTRVHDIVSHKFVHSGTDQRARRGRGPFIFICKCVCVRERERREDRERMGGKLWREKWRMGWKRRKMSGSEETPILAWFSHEQCEIENAFWKGIRSNATICPSEVSTRVLLGFQLRHVCLPVPSLESVNFVWPHNPHSLLSCRDNCVYLQAEGAVWGSIFCLDWGSRGEGGGFRQVPRVPNKSFMKDHDWARGNLHIPRNLKSRPRYAVARFGWSPSPLYFRLAY